MSDLSRSLRAGAKYGTEDLRHRERSSEIIQDLIDEGTQSVANAIKREKQCGMKYISLETIHCLIETWWTEKCVELGRTRPQQSVVTKVIETVQTEMVELFRSSKE
jgi:hypothetical protein